MPSRVVRSSTPVATEPLDPAQIVEGAPETGIVELHEDGIWSVGVWEHTVGTSTDVEVDEVFVVLSGRATIEIDDHTETAGDTAFDGTTVLEVGPGDIGILEAGARTTWTVHEQLRKIYVTRGDL